MTDKHNFELNNITMERKFSGVLQNKTNCKIYSKKFIQLSQRFVLPKNLTLKFSVSNYTKSTILTVLLMQAP